MGLFYAHSERVGCCMNGNASTRWNSTAKTIKGKSISLFVEVAHCNALSFTNIDQRRLCDLLKWSFVGAAEMFL